MNRRDALRVGGTCLAAASAGCASLFRTTNSRAPPLVENRPEAIYVPSHVEGMKMIGTGQVGRRTIALMYSYPHRFWTVTGSDRKKVEIGRDDAVHLMASVFDTETETVLPAGSNVRFKITQNGETVDNRSPWSMLSQNMGFHFGDNVPLDGNGTYTVEVQLGSLGLTRTGEFTDAFGQSGSVSMQFDFSESTLNEIPYRMLEDRKGNHGAVDPMEMQIPLSFAPEQSKLPGTMIGTGESGDVRFRATGIQRGGNTYLAVSPATRFNRYVVPMMSLSGTLTRSGTTVFDGQLNAALDPELGYYYAAQTEQITGDETLTVTVDTPPQVSRHEGYDTAVFDLPKATIGG